MNGNSRTKENFVGKAAIALMATFAAIAIALSFAAPAKAYAMPEEIHGSAYIHCTNPGQTNNDGNVFDVTLSYSGRSYSGFTGYCQDYGMPYPADGWYDYTATWVTSCNFPNHASWGAHYDVLIDSSGATPHPQCVYTTGPCQRVGGLDTAFNPLGDIDLQKASSNPSVSDGNPCYSLAGAVYGVYRSDSDARSDSNRVASLVTNDSGYAKAANVEPGNYFVREVSPAKGYGLDNSANNPYTVYVAPGSTGRVNGNQGGIVYDAPQNDPAVMFVGKIDYDTNSDMPQGSASLAEAEYTVKYYAGYFDGNNLPNISAKTWVFKTNSKGYALLSERYLVSGDALYLDAGGIPIIPLGTLTIQETKAPEGYLLGDAPLYVEQITSEGNIPEVGTYNAPKDPERVMRGGIAIVKHDSVTGAKAQGDASLSGISFEIVNSNENAVVVDGRTVQPGEVCAEITTDSNGEAKTASDLLPYGTYTVREKSTNDSMLNTSRAQTVKVEEDGVVVPVADAYSDDVVRGGLTFEKLDKETKDNWPLEAGGSDLSATFEITNESAASVQVNGRLYQKGEVVYTGKAEKTDGGWVFETAADLLPYGTYSIKETAPGTGYEQSEQAFTFEVRENGELVDLGARTFENQIVRADVKWQKKDDSTGSKMAGVAFLVRSQTSGEAHVIVTDENGIVDTSANRGDANANDAALTGASMADWAVDESKLDASNGVWFGKTHAGGITAEDGSLGALPYDSYDVIELPCKANEGRQLIADTLVVGRSDDRGLVDFGTLDDVEPHIHTNAYDGSSGNPYDNEVNSDDEAWIADKVSWEDFIPGREYEFTAEAHWADNGEIVKDASGNEVRAVKKVKADSKAGSVVMGLEFDGTGIEDGRKIVVYEYAKYEGREVAKHEDASDAEQTVSMRAPAIGTTAKSADASKTVKLDPESKVVDAIGYTGLRPGAAYTATLELVDGNGDAVTDAAGNPVKAQKRFTADASGSGTVDVEAVFDATKLDDGTKIVCFETVTKDRTGNTVAEHKDLSDEGQTLTTAKPKVGTTLTDEATGGHTAVVDDAMTLVDSVEYWNLEADGRVYEMRGALMLVTAGDDGEESVEPLKDANGEAVTATREFVPDTPHGFVEIRFDLNGLNLPDNAKIVAYETLARANAELASHKDPADEGQTVIATKPKIGTTLADDEGAKTVPSSASMRLVDTVSYSGAKVGAEYALRATLNVVTEGDDGEVAVAPLLDADGGQVAGEAAFTAQHDSGAVDVEMTFDGSSLPHGAKLVCFESMTRSGTEIASHEDASDEGQTVEVASPEVTTGVRDALDGDQTVVADKEAKVIDTATYENLIKGGSYTAIGMLIDKSTGLPAYVSEDEDGSAKLYKEILAALGTDDEALAAYAEAKSADAEGTSWKATEVNFDALQAALSANAGALAKSGVFEKSFSPERADGSVELELAIDASKWIGAEEPAELVAYEFLVTGGKLVAVHADMDSAEQTFAVVPSKIGTTLTDSTDGDHTVLPSSDAALTDTVAYEDLVPGKEYELAGKLMDKSTGKPLMVGDKEVTASAKFTPNEASGAAKVEFELDTSSLDGKEIVAFETLTKDGTEVARHEDVSDANQTVAVDKLNGAKGKDYEKTGIDLLQRLLPFAALIAAGAGLAAWGVVKSRRAKAGAQDSGNAGGLFG